MSKTLQVNKEETKTRPQADHYIAPSVDISESKDAYTLEADLPGVRKEDLEITVEGQELTIVGRPAVEANSGSLLLGERPRASYRRVFDLNPTIDTTRISARVDQGLLTLTLPKTEQVKPRKIALTD